MEVLMRRWTWWILWAVCLLAAIVWPVGMCAAQIEEEDREESYWRNIVESEVRYLHLSERSFLYGLAVLCELSEEQAEASRTLHEAYVPRVAATKRKVEEYLYASRQRSWLGEITGEEHIKHHNNADREQRAYKQKLWSEFEVDLKDLLTPEQLVHLPVLEKLCRVHVSSWILYVGQRVPDILRILQDAEVEMSPELRAIIERYITELDLLVVEYKREMPMFSDKVWEIQLDETLSYEQQDAAIRLLENPSKKLLISGREVSTETLRRMLPLLPEIKTAEVELHCYEYYDYLGDSSPRNFGAVCRKLLGLPSITEMQREGIREVYLEFIKARIAERKVEVEENLAADKSPTDLTDEERLVHLQAYMEGVSRGLERLRGLLTEEQIEEAGPPLREVRLYIPDFEADDEPPQRDLSKLIWLAPRQYAAPQVNAVDLAFLTRTVGLSEEQREAAGDLLSAYEGRVRLAVRKQRAFHESATYHTIMGRPSSDIDRRRERVEFEVDRHTSRLRVELLDDWRLILTDEQASKWESFERRVERKPIALGMRSLQVGVQSADLPAMLEQAIGGVDAIGDELAAVVELYEREMAALVKEVAALDVKSRERIAKALDGEGGAIAGSDPKIDAAAWGLSMRIFELNQQYFRRFCELLEGKSRKEFEAMMHRSLLHDRKISAHWKARADMAILERAIQGMNDLTEAQKRRIGEILGENEDAAHQARMLLYEEFAAIVPKRIDPEAWNGALRSSQCWTLAKNLWKIETETAAKLIAELTPEQKKKVPRSWLVTIEDPSLRFDEE